MRFVYSLGGLRQCVSACVRRGKKCQAKRAVGESEASTYKTFIQQTLPDMSKMPLLNACFFPFGCSI